MIKILFINVDVHHKNLHSLLSYKCISFDIVDNINLLDTIDLTSYDCVLSPTIPINVSKYPNTKFIFGPHFSIFPNDKLKIIEGPNAVYNLLSSWIINIWSKNTDYCNVKFIALPFGIDTNKFLPNQKLVQKNRCFLYFKRRNPTQLAFLMNVLINNHIEYKIFKYGEYNENDYIEYLKTCEFGFWLDAHESQGFALQEALSINIPLLVWNVKFMSQEYGSNYQNYEATTIPYWNEQCGEYFYEQNEFEDKYKLFMNKLKTYEPRQYILNNLSMEVCEQKLIDLINDLKTVSSH